MKIIYHIDLFCHFLYRLNTFRNFGYFNTSCPFYVIFLIRRFYMGNLEVVLYRHKNGIFIMYFEKVLVVWYRFLFK